MALSATQNASDLRAEIEKYRKALEENPDSRLFAALADSLRKAGEIKDAISVAEAGVARHPKYMSGMVVLAQAYQAAQNFHKALDLFLKVTRMNPENIIAQRAIADIYDHLGDHENALKSYNVLTLLDPTDIKARKRLELLEATAPPKTPKKAAPKPSPLPPEPEEDEKTVELPPPAPAQDRAGQATGPPSAQSAPDEDSATMELPSVDMAQDPDSILGSAVPGIPSHEEVLEPPPEPPPPVSAEKHEPEPPAPEREKPAPEPAPASPKKPAAPKKPAGPKLSEEEKLDLFFSGSKLDSVGIADKAEGYVVKKAEEALPSKGGTQAVAITSSKLAKVFWDQGFRAKALSVMAHEVLVNPGDHKLMKEFKAAAEFEVRDADELLAEARAELEKESELPDRAAQKPEPTVTESPAADDGPDDGKGAKAAESEGPAAHDPLEDTDPAIEPLPDKIRILKSYLSKIKQDKEKKP